jgi:Protein of unknown function (DUF3300)
MNKTSIKDFLCLLLVGLSVLLSIQAGECGPSSLYLFTDQELDDLLAPIALYPDPLLAEILPASTYPEEVADAAAWLTSGGDPSGIDEKNWDEAVKAVAHYPNILFMMSGDLDWTADLGDAFLNQPEEVTKSIQRLRWRAKAVGNLVSNNEQTVVIEGEYIQIIPAQPQYIYVPQYDPAVVYVQRPAVGISPFITFGFGLAIGGWLSMDFDWYNHHVIYHGWNRHGWVNNARPYVHITNVYVNRSRPYINQNWRHDASHGGPDRYWASRPSGPYAGRYPRTPNVRGRATTPPRASGGMFGYKRDAQASSNRGRDSLAAIRPRMPTPAPGVSQKPPVPTPSVSQRQATSAPAVSQAPTRPAPGVSLQPSAPSTSQRQAMPAPRTSSGISQPSSGRGSAQPARTTSSAFGGYRGTNEARTQSLRGQDSRQSSVGAPPPPSPASRGSAPAGKAAPQGKQGPQR